MAPRLQVKVDRLDQVMRSIRDLTKEHVLVGVPSSTADRQPDADDPLPINNATIGYIMETGSPAKNIPARPHLVPAVAEISDAVAERYRDGAKAALDGRGDIHKTHEIVGLMAQNAVRRKVTEGGFAPLAPATIANRRARGRTGIKPLIDTGQYRASLTYVIRSQGG